jgi:hypothetical protein
MPITYRIVDPGGGWLARGDPNGDLKGPIADLEPGRYTVKDPQLRRPGPSISRSGDVRARTRPSPGPVHGRAIRHAASRAMLRLGGRMTSLMAQFELRGELTEILAPALP